MAVLVPQPLPDLLRRMYAEHARTGAIYDLEAREIWRGPSEGLDLSVENHGAGAATGVGPAAGPHAQLAQNIALSWLAGARIIELKTVQILDRLDIARPCIDAQNIGFNIEWSQELTLDESLREYVHGWFLIHAAKDLLGMKPEVGKTLLDVSVGYSLDGVRADPVRRSSRTPAARSREISPLA
jgi:putative selenate reductase